MDIVKEHFEREADEYDQIIIRLIPYYPQMVNALISAIPQKRDEVFKVMDLGCGTGTISGNIVDCFPNVDITCLDIAENMIELAKYKMANHPHSKFLLADLNTFSFQESYDVIVSSLALHHLCNDKDKQNFYKKIHNALTPGGVFLNADVILGSSEFLQGMYLEKWKIFMLKQVPLDEIEQTWLPNYYREDHPTSLLDQLSWLSEIGFIETDVIWKYYNFAVYGGKKAE